MLISSHPEQVWTSRGIGHVPPCVSRKLDRGHDWFPRVNAKLKGLVLIPDHPGSPTHKLDPLVEAMFGI